MGPCSPRGDVSRSVRPDPGGLDKVRVVVRGTRALVGRTGRVREPRVVLPSPLSGHGPVDVVIPELSGSLVDTYFSDYKTEAPTTAFPDVNWDSPGVLPRLSSS